ncbi:MAG: DNA cytosine methyltransferase [Candidatus Woesearchaeota archaeon]
MRTIDLFAGVGGVRLGFENAGFTTVFANDFEPACKETYDLNSKEAHLTVMDINKLKISDLPEFDLLLGGFPCQAFSIAGYRKGFDDDKGRGALFFKVAEIIAERKPKAIFLENVKNLKTHDNGKTFNVIKNALEDIGYHVKYEILNSMTHGNVPQNRERIFIVGFLDKKCFDKFKFPEEIDLTTNFRELLDTSVDGKYYYNGKTIYSRLKNDIVSKDKVYQWRRRYVRENKSGVVPTLTANMGTGGHNVPIILDDKGIRKLTPKECFLMQGFPRSFKLPRIADSKLYQQAGNSVSVPVVERIAKEIKKVL